MNENKMKITLVIEDSRLNIKKAIAKGWNNRFNEKLTYKDIKGVDIKEDIISAIPYLDSDNIEINVKFAES